MLLRVSILILMTELLGWLAPAHAQLNVIVSGGFASAYGELVPVFERETGHVVVTGSGASQGSGPQTIKAQLQRGVPADVVILSAEGLEELTSKGHVLAGSAVGLARAPLGAAVKAGAVKPALGSVDDVRRTLLAARLIAMPGSTSGLYIQGTMLPRLGIAGAVRFKITPRGRDATAMLAAGEADMALAPASELVNIPGVEFIGTLPEELQLVQTFTAAVVQGSKQQEQARALLAFLSSARASDAIRRSGMLPAAGR